VRRRETIVKQASKQPRLRVFNLKEPQRPRVVDERFTNLGDFGQWILREAMRRQNARRGVHAPHLRLIDRNGRYVR